MAYSSGQNVEAYWDDDGQWYNARVDSIEGDLYNITYLDYGNQATVDDQYLRPLPGSSKKVAPSQPRKGAPPVPQKSIPPPAPAKPTFETIGRFKFRTDYPDPPIWRATGSKVYPSEDPSNKPMNNVMQPISKSAGMKTISSAPIPALGSSVPARSAPPTRSNPPPVPSGKPRTPRQAPTNSTRNPSTPSRNTTQPRVPKKPAPNPRARPVTKKAPKAPPKKVPGRRPGGASSQTDEQWLSSAIKRLALALEKIKKTGDTKKAENIGKTIKVFKTILRGLEKAKAEGDTAKIASLSEKVSKIRTKS